MGGAGGVEGAEAGFDDLGDGEGGAEEGSGPDGRAHGVEEGRFDGAGADGGDAEAAGVVLGPESFGEGEDVGLGGGVGGHVGGGLEGSGGGDVEHRAAAGEELGDEEAGEFGEGDHVELQHLGEVVGIFVFKGTEVAEAGAVDEGIDGEAEALDFVEELAGGAGGGKVEGEKGGATADGVDALGERGEAFGGAGGEEEVGGAACEVFGEGGADAGGGAGEEDDGGLARQCHVTMSNTEWLTVSRGYVRLENMSVDLRMRVLEASAELIAEAGLGGLSMREVARRAGVSHQAPYHHFADKAAIVAALVGRGFAMLGDRLEEAAAGLGGIRARLERVGRAYVTFALDEPVYFRLLFRPDLMDLGRFPEVTAEGARTYGVLQGLVAEEAGVGSSREEQEAMASLHWSLVHGLATLLLDGNLGAKLELGTRAAQERHIEAVLRAFGRR